MRNFTIMPQSEPRFLHVLFDMGFPTTVLYSFLHVPRTPFRLSLPQEYQYLVRYANYEASGYVVF